MNVLKISKRKRFRQIVSILVKNGFKEGSTNPQKMRTTLEDLGPTFVKIGQILSTRPDILPESYIEEFTKLQDDVRPEDFPFVKAIVEKEFAAPLGTIFSFFEEEPMASASMAQVHKATLISGEKVVVKVKRPNIEQVMLTDLAILNSISMVINIIPQGSVLNSQEVVGELLKAVKEELDFVNEGENIEKFYELNKDVDYLKVPKIYKEYTGKELLIMEYIDGYKFSNKFKLIELGYDLKEISIKLVNSFLKQVFEDGFFHADPHPGNILIIDNKIAFLDFGLMGTLSPQLKNKLNKLLFSLVTGDMENLTRIILQLGVKRKKVDRRVLLSDIDDIYNQYITASIEELDIPELIDQLFCICRRHSISIPRDVTLISKSFLLMESNLASTSPELTIMDIATPYVRNHFLNNRNIKEESLKFLGNIHRATSASIKIPEKLLSILNKMSTGTALVQMEHINLDRNVNKMTRAADRISFALILSSIIVGSSFIITSEVGPKIYDISILGLLGYIGAAIIGIWLVIAILRSGRI